MIARKTLVTVPRQNKRKNCLRSGARKQLLEKCPKTGTLPLSSKVTGHSRKNRSHNGLSVHYPRVGDAWAPAYFGRICRRFAIRCRRSIDRIRLTVYSAKSMRPPGIKRDLGYPQAAAYGYTASLSSRRLRVDNLPKERLQTKAIREISPDSFHLTSSEEELTNEAQFA